MALRMRLSRRRALALGAAATLVTAGVVVPATMAQAAVSCGVTYTQAWSNQSQFGANVVINNTGDAVNGWSLVFNFPNSATVSNGWPVGFAQSGSQVTISSNADWNASIPSGGSFTAGFNANGQFAQPSSFTLNGVTCNGSTPPPTTPPPTTPPPTTPPPTTPPPTTPPPTTPPPTTAQALVVTPTAISVPEGGTATFAVKLQTQPSSNVTVTTTAGSGDTSLTVSSGGSPTFTTANWNTNQTVTLAAAQDSDTTNGTRPFTVASSGLTSVTVTATEIDDDVPSGSKVDNPYAGATGYINPDWHDEVIAEANAHTGALANQMRNIANTPTAVWLDRIGAITAGRGLVGHLDAAVAQDAANGSAPVVITLVIYDLPNRDCAALASNGELLIADGGMTRYQNEYIAPIKSILANPAYANLRISLIMEVDSLPNLVTNLSQSKCAEANQAGGYVDGVRYAVSQLSTIANTYIYMDIAHSGWLGWNDNFSGILQVMDRTLATSQGGPGYDKIHGFITNTANYTPTEEIFLPNSQLQVGGQPIQSSDFYEWNPRLDEKTFAQNLQAEFATRGCNAPNTCGMLIDTSRNGWGGSARPTAVSSSTNLNTYVNESRLDRRPHRGDWCNQNGAGMGARPTANTGIAGVDAFVWVKPPGESDGVSQAGIIDPDDPAKGFDAMCDPTAANRYDSDYGTNALPNAPHAGRWFPAQFAQLVQNAYPAIPAT